MQVAFAVTTMGMPMRNQRLLVVFLSAVALSRAAQAAPIPGDSLQGQLAARSAQIPAQVNSDPTRNSAAPTPNLFSQSDVYLKPMTGSHRAAEYLPDGARTFNILASTSAPLPEPPSLLLLGTGILGLAAVWRLRRSKT